MKILELACAMSLCVATGAMATPMLIHNWRELSLTTADGAHVEGKADAQDRLVALSVSKGGNTCVVEPQTLARMTDASLNGIEVEEDMTHPSVQLVVKAKEFDPATGNAMHEIDWHLWCDDSRISRVEKKVRPIPR